MLNGAPETTTTIRTSWITPHHSFFQELICVIISPPITPNQFWGFNKRNSQEYYTTLVLSLLGNIAQSFTPKHSQGISWRSKFTSVTPENSWGINCVILAGPMVNFAQSKLEVVGICLPIIALPLKRGKQTEPTSQFLADFLLIFQIRLSLELQHSQGKTPWVDSACGDCPAFLVLGAAPALASTFVSEPQIVPLGQHFALRALGQLHSGGKTSR